MENLTAAERETTITLCDDDELVRIWTAQRPVITRLRKNAAYTEVASGAIGTSPWAEFTCPVARFTFGAKRVYSADSLAKMRERGFPSQEAS